MSRFYGWNLRMDKNRINFMLKIMLLQLDDNFEKIEYHDVEILLRNFLT